MQYQQVYQKLINIACVMAAIERSKEKCALNTHAAKKELPQTQTQQQHKPQVLPSLVAN